VLQPLAGHLLVEAQLQFLQLLLLCQLLVELLLQRLS
jgi:hypothetical protein